MSPYSTEVPLLTQPSTQGGLLGIHAAGQTYYDAASLQHMSVHGDNSNMQHATRAHPQTVS